MACRACSAKHRGSGQLDLEGKASPTLRRDTRRSCTEGRRKVPSWLAPVLHFREEARKDLAAADKRMADALGWRPMSARDYKWHSKRPGRRPAYFDGSPRNDPHKATREAAAYDRERRQREQEYAERQKGNAA